MIVKFLISTFFSCFPGLKTCKVHVESLPMLRVMGKFDEKWGELSPMKAAARVLPSNMPRASQTGTL